jgi:hypothetical protein
VLPGPHAVSPKTLVTERISALSDGQMREIAEAVRFALDPPLIADTKLRA